MTRKKVKLAYISNDSSRKTTFKKRKKGLMKKVKELSTLCGINACAIIYSPYDSNPEVWPSNSGVQRIVSEFRTLPEMDQQKKMVDQETFLRQRIAKASEQLKRQIKDNRELEMTEVMFQCLVGNMGMFHMNIMDLNALGYLIDQYLRDINRRFEILQSSGMEIGESSNALDERIGSMAVMASTTAPTTTTNEAFLNPLQQQQQLFRHPSPPHVGFYEQPRSLNINLNQDYNQNQQQWFMEMMHHPEHYGDYAYEQKGFPFIDDNHHQPQHQHQQILGDSSTVSAVVSSSSTVPVTNPNLTNNTWFR